MVKKFEIREKKTSNDISKKSFVLKKLCPKKIGPKEFSQKNLGPKIQVPKNGSPKISVQNNLRSKKCEARKIFVQKFFVSKTY